MDMLENILKDFYFIVEFLNFIGNARSMRMHLFQFLLDVAAERKLPF